MESIEYMWLLKHLGFSSTYNYIYAILSTKNICGILLYDGIAREFLFFDFFGKQIAYIMRNVHF